MPCSALLQVERSSDDTVKLKILQTALTLLQNPSNADDQVSDEGLVAAQLLIRSQPYAADAHVTSHPPWPAAASLTGS
jgi:hypothetical protein